MDKVLAETDWGCHPCRAYVRKNIFLYSSVSLRGIRGDWIVTRLLTWPQRKLPKPADLKSFFVSFFFVLLQQRGLWCDRANTSTFSILVHPYVSCPSCTCPRVDLQQPEHASTACLPAAQPSSCSPPHHLLDILYALDKLPAPNPPPANVYWSKHKYGCGKGI